MKIDIARLCRVVGMCGMVSVSCITVAWAQTAIASGAGLGGTVESMLLSLGFPGIAFYLMWQLATQTVKQNTDAITALNITVEKMSVKCLANTNEKDTQDG